MLTKEYLNKLFEYKDGKLFWKVKKSGVTQGKQAGNYDGFRYRQLRIDGKLYKEHRVIFCFFHGHIPKEVDHINNNPLDNRIENLRPANRSQNMRNSLLRKDSISGCKGVGFIKKTSKWRVRIWTDSGRIYLGDFEDLELAKLVATEARNKYHGEFVNHGDK